MEPEGSLPRIVVTFRHKSKLRYWLNYGYLQLSIKDRDVIAKYLLPFVDVSL